MRCVTLNFHENVKEIAVEIFVEPQTKVFTLPITKLETQCIVLPLHLTFAMLCFCFGIICKRKFRLVYK